ncbi:TMEM175 family protein [Rurimicrobium arvi]|uniref:TMEM175 family protein n=1 Tax=Rurimicrobium arvi TaxID=2049916 RepID=UPI003CD07BE2
MLSQPIERAKLLDIKRIQMLTDAIFAVAMTILILELKIPSGLSTANVSSEFFTHTIWQLGFYFFSFVILGIFWTGSHFHHHLITETDRVSSWMNIFFLMFICIIPFSAGFINHYRHERLSIIFYALNLIMASLFNLLMLAYAWKRKYIQPYVSKADFNNARQRILFPIYIYVLVIAVSFVSTRIAILLFFTPILLHLIPETINKKQVRGC